MAVAAMWIQPQPWRALHPGVSERGSLQAALRPALDRVARRVLMAELQHGVKAAVVGAAVANVP
jgi:hypothetical protein|tara:strand:- start:836 stop:1027 length:192 start_codon:yes stop_codon:yes gene_type:complete